MTTRVQTLHSGRKAPPCLEPSSSSPAVAPGSAPVSDALDPIRSGDRRAPGLWGSGFGREDRYSGFLSSRRPGWPAWSTSSATIAALRGSEGRLLGTRGGVVAPSPLPPGASSSLLRPSECLRLQIQNPSESGINVSHEFSGNLSNPGGEIGFVEGHDLSDVGDGVLREPGACR